jgi:uncharacterized protein YndB with AHSA1/START domain
MDRPDYPAFAVPAARSGFFSAPAPSMLVSRYRRQSGQNDHTTGEQNMIKKIALGVLAIIVLILGLAAMQPDSFSVRRSIAVKAPPEKIAPLLTDFHQWASWSPWEKLDPNMKRTFSGAASGKGAVYEWEGNSDVGKGRMEILDASTPARTVVKLAFLDPVESHSTTEFTLTPRGDSTTVTWNMHGPMPFLSKLMTVFMNMDDMIGKDFDKGLAQLKTAAEK